MFKLVKLNGLRDFSVLAISILIICSSQISPQALVGHWAMEESGGATVLTDSSASGNDANVTGSLLRVNGQRGFAQEFDGTNDYALVPDDASLDLTGAITLAAWIKPTTTGTQYIINKAINDMTDGYELSLSSTGKVFVRFNQATSLNDYRILSSTSYPVDGNTWMHIAATFDGTNIKLYINGTQEGGNLPGLASIAANDLSLGIGAQSNGLVMFQGVIDDTRVYDYALNLTEIQALTATWKPLVGHWAMEESSGAPVLIDSSSYGNDADVTSPSSLVQVNGQRSMAQDFDGTNDFALVPDDASLDIANAITLAAWIKPDNTVTKTQYIIKKAIQNGTPATDDGYELSLSSGGVVFVRFNQATSTNTYRLDSTTPYPTDGTTWMHIAATYDGTNIRIYIDGVLEGTKSGPTSITTNTLLLGIGAQSDGVSLFEGTIDDARIYNRALDLTEVQALMTTWGSPGPPAPVLLSPANGSTGISITPTLSWNASTGATSYQVQVSTVSDFSSTVFDQAGITATSVQVTGLLKNTVHYWRVNATDGTTSGEWSSYWSFTTILSTENNGAGYALDFDGTNDYVDCGSSTMFDMTGAITMEAWISTDVERTQSIIKKNASGSGYELSLSNPPGKVFVRLNGNNTYRIDSGISYPFDSSWIHVAATYDGTTIRLYVNGVSEGSVAGTTIVTNSNNLVIGTDAASLGTKNFSGRIDEVRLWNVARTETQIRDNMCKKLSGSESGLVGYWDFNETEGNLLSDLTANNNDGILTNRDDDEHVWSGAAVGDVSANDYSGTVASDFEASITLGSESFIATGSAGTITGIQVYRVDDNSVRAGSNPPGGWTADPLRYWGVKVFGGGAYDLKYVYTGHSGLGIETDLRLVKRDNLSDDDWVDAGASLEETGDSLTLTGQSGSEYALASISAPLPVELKSFTAKIDYNTVILKWQTETEVDNYGFEVQRSAFGVQSSDWQVLGFMEGYGNSNSPKEYSFVDENINLNRYSYRLKQIDTDGSFTFSEIVEVDLGLPTKFELSQNYPNPFNPITNITFTILENSEVSLKIFNTLGETVSTLVNEKKDAGSYTVKFDATKFPSGIYFYRLQAGEFIVSKKMVLIK